MTKTLLDGPGRVLESVYPRFLVDLAQGDDARLPQAHQQQFRERLMQELLARVQLQTWTNGGMLNAPLSLRLTMVEKLASMLDPGHLALTQIAPQHGHLGKKDQLPHPPKGIPASTLLSRSSPSKLPPCMSGFQPVVAGRKRR